MLSEQGCDKIIKRRLQRKPESYTEVSFLTESHFAQSVFFEQILKQEPSSVYNPVDNVTLHALIFQ